jgi:glutamine amidotransferase
VSRNVTVVDYGIGNLYSVRRALESCGAEVTLSADPDFITASERMVLPGVGAFDDGMRGLRERNLVEPIRQFAASGKPLLGICLGMQMLASVSEEFGTHEGLGIIPGRVVAVQPTTVTGERHKIPNVGWRALLPAAGADWSQTPFANTTPGSAVYLVHSYHCIPDDPRHTLAYCEYGGHPVTCAIGSGRIIGCQFHPEKSGSVGLTVLARFLD